MTLTKLQEKVLKQINELSVPRDMKQMAWDWYLFGYIDGVEDSHLP